MMKSKDEARRVCFAPSSHSFRFSTDRAAARPAPTWSVFVVVEHLSVVSGGGGGGGCGGVGSGLCGGVAAGGPAPPTLNKWQSIASLRAAAADALAAGR